MQHTFSAKHQGLEEEYKVASSFLKLKVVLIVNWKTAVFRIYLAYFYNGEIRDSRQPTIHYPQYPPL
jgi:hypothetical protein